MKITTEKEFNPITIVLESNEEAVVTWLAIVLNAGKALNSGVDGRFITNESSRKLSPIADRMAQQLNEVYTMGQMV